MAEKEKKETSLPEEEQEILEENAQQETLSEEDDQINRLKEENEELKNKVLRQMAEFDNFKKRTSREKDELYSYAKADCVSALLGVVDNFERALETECADSQFKQGVEMIFTQMKDTLKKLGVEEIEALNQTFDPEYHNAVNQVEDKNFGENVVCQVFQKGYKLGNKVIRHSMVVVANP